MSFNSQTFLENISSHECLLNSGLDKGVLKGEVSFSFQDNIENKPVNIKFLPYKEADGLIGGRFKFTLTFVDITPKMSVESSAVNALIKKHDLDWHKLHLNEEPSTTKDEIDCCIAVGAELKQKILDGETPTKFFETTILSYFMMWVYIDFYGFIPKWYEERSHYNRGLYESFDEYGHTWTDEVFKDFILNLRNRKSTWNTIDINTLDFKKYRENSKYRISCDRALRHSSDDKYIEILGRLVKRCKKLKLLV